MGDNVGMSQTSDFFRRSLPAAIVAEPERFALLHGRLAFSCAGEKFTVALGDLDAPVVAGFDRGAEVKLWFFGDAFERFLCGEEVKGKQAVRVEGDAGVLDRLGLFLRPAKASGVSVRFGAAAL